MFTCQWSGLRIWIFVALWVCVCLCVCYRGQQGWRYHELMLGTDEILLSKYDIAKGQTRAL